MPIKSKSFKLFLGNSGKNHKQGQSRNIVSNSNKIQKFSFSHV